MELGSMKTQSQIEVQKWKVGDFVVSKETDFDITKGKKYEILARSAFSDCFLIKDDSGEKVEYSQDYFDLILNDELSPVKTNKPIEVQKWKVGDFVVSKETDFGITKDKKYKILAKSLFYDCFYIQDDTGKKVEYSQDYFELVVE